MAQLWLIRKWRVATHHRRICSNVNVTEGGACAFAPLLVHYRSGPFRDWFLSELFILFALSSGWFIRNLVDMWPERCWSHLKIMNLAFCGGREFTTFGGGRSTASSWESCVLQIDVWSIWIFTWVKHSTRPKKKKFKPNYRTLHVLDNGLIDFSFLDFSKKANNVGLVSSIIFLYNLFLLAKLFLLN